MPNHDRFECQTVIDSDAILQDNAIGTLNAGECPVIHSDRSGHYRWPGWLERVNAAGLIAQCPVKDVHQIMQHVTGSSAG